MLEINVRIRTKQINNDMITKEEGKWEIMFMNCRMCLLYRE